MSSPGNLGALLFGGYRRDALALLLLHPEATFHVREVARMTGRAAGTMLRELNALADAGILDRQRVGNQVRFQANANCPIFDDLRNILKRTAGIADVLREALEPLAERLDVVFVFGSVARGDERAGSDIDLMVIGEVSFAEVIEALTPAQAVLRRAVNPTVYPPGEFRKKARDEPFLARVLDDKRIFVIGSDDDLGKLAAYRQAAGARGHQA
jgi:predicted nucleotidyltransferase